MRLLFLLSLLANITFAATSIHPESDALHLDWRDLNIPIKQDFYTYANGTWQKQNPIPAEYSTWSNFSILQEKTLDAIHQILITAEKQKSQPGSIEQKVGDFYFSGMDETNINRLGAKPLESEFARINAIQNQTDLEAEIAHLHLIGIDALFGFGSMQDFKHSTQMIAAITQGGLTLPDRDYYLKDEARFKQIRAAYLQHMMRMFQLLGDTASQAEHEANIVMSIETMLAKDSMSQIAMRDPYAIYHMKTVKELDEMTPHFSWSAYLKAMTVERVKQVNLATPNFIKMINEQLQNVPLSEWKTYLRWHLLDQFAPYLSQPFVDQDFRMSQSLTGAEKLLPRWKRVTNTENSALGFAIGRLYVEKYFSSTAKQAILDIVHNIRLVLQKDLQTLPWMTPATRKAALKKLAAMQERIGYPSKWWDYSKLQIDRGPYVLNILRASQFLIERDLNKIDKPVDRTEWDMSPQTINAYYNPSMNNINLPTGILQPPFFVPSAPAAINYGAIGFVVGHEITHGFDDQGAQFDENGNLKNWWTPEDLKKFKAATECIAQQFSRYKVEKNAAVQGHLVVGEATADLGGLTLAYRAFRLSKAYKTAPTIDGLTPDQQFFIAAAHIWATNMRPEQMRNQVTIDPHPPAMYRVNGTVANMPQFQSAFGLSMESNKNQCKIW
jgi:putative endopeptidase